MITLASLIPDIEVLLALAPEELAKTLLLLAHKRGQNGMFDPENVTSVTVGIGIATTAASGYPDGKDYEREIALSEAWNWLKVNSLIVPAPGMPARNGWYVISRIGRKLLGEGNFDKFRQAAAFPKSLLHPSIADKVWLELSRGDLDIAVFTAFKAVEESIREAGGYDPTDIGTTLVRKAFDKATGRLSNMSQPEAEREALAHLFAGAIGSYKNPHSHRTISLTDPREAQEMTLLASHLLRIVDARRPK